MKHRVASVSVPETIVVGVKLPAEGAAQNPGFVVSAAPDTPFKTPPAVFDCAVWLPALAWCMLWQSVHFADVCFRAFANCVLISLAVPFAAGVPWQL